MFKWLRELKINRQVRREQKLRERCVKYAIKRNVDLFYAAVIYRFIVKGTFIERDREERKDKEYLYPNLQGIIQEAESLQ